MTYGFQPYTACKKCLAWRGLERQQLLYCAPKACMLQRRRGSCMQVLTKPAPRLWPEQYTLVGGVPPLMPSTTLLQSDGCPSQPPTVRPQHDQHTDEDVQCVSGEAPSQL